jgi:hypothetical protein
MSFYFRFFYVPGKWGDTSKCRQSRRVNKPKETWIKEVQAMHAFKVSASKREW